MVDSFLRQGIPEVAKQLTKKSTKAVTWDTAVKQLSHQTQQTLNVSKITNKGDLLPDQVKVMEDLVQTNPEDGVRLLREYEDGLLNDNWHNFKGHFSEASQKYDQDVQRASLDNSKGMKIDPDPDPEDLTPLGPWPLKKSGEGVFEPEIDDSLSRSLLAANDQKDLVKGLKTPLYSELAEHNIEITPEELVSSGMFDTMLKRQGMLEEQSIVTKDYRTERDAFKAAGYSADEHRPYKRSIKNFKTNNRSLMDLASLNLFTKTKDVFGINRNALKKQLSIFGEGKKEWHHTFFQNKAGGNLFLNKISQDPIIAANLMLKLKKLNIATSGTIENLSLLDKVPHGKLHNKFKEVGLESWYDTNAEMFRGGELDITEYIKEIGQSVAEGKTSINEMFDILDVYAEVVIPYIKEQTEAVGPGFKNIKGFEDITENYVSKTDVKLDRNIKPKKTPAKQKTVPSPPK